MIRALALLLLAPAAFAAPKIDTLTVKPNPAAFSSGKPPEVEVVISVTKGGGNCDARVEFGDGKGRNVDFGLATIRALKYTYGKSGSYKVAVKGTGKTPCAGEKEVALNVTGAPAQKKAAEKKKAEKKKAAAKKKDEKKKDEQK